MAIIKLDLLRVDDLLNLQIEGDNLQLDASKPDDPALVLQDARQPAYLIVTFPPQTIVEQAVFESSPVPPPQREDGKTSPYDTVHPPQVSPSLPMLARIGGDSRLVFKIPAGSNIRIPYTVEGLIDWAGLDLSVSPLADVPPAPTSQQRQNAPGIQPPSRQQTAIELPYRLVLSPNHAVAWENARQPKTYQGITELWHTRLALKDSQGEILEISRLQPAPLRAIWSPDFNASKLWATDPPIFGELDADWNDPRLPLPFNNVLTPMTASDRHEIVVLTSAFHGYVKDKDDFRDYEPAPVFAEQLMLSPLGGWLKSRGEWDPPAPFRPLFIIHPGNQKKWDAYVKDLTKIRSVIDIQRNLSPAELLAAASDLQGGETVDQPQLASLAAPNASVVTKVSAGNLGNLLWPGLIGFTGDLLNLSEWTHIATMGRDHYVRIVYEGHLYPFGHRASLIKVTERKIRDVPMPDGSTTPLAYLVQHLFIVVRQPLRDYTLPEVHSLLENGGRGLPFKNIRLTTLVTPDIANPNNPPPSSKIPGTTYSFWVRLGQGAGSGDDFKFHGIAEDIAGNQVDFTASLIFIPFGEGTPGRNLVFGAYTASGEERACIVPGQKVTYAPAAPGGANENTNLTTTALYFTNQGKAVPFNKKTGGFMPKLFKASVKLPAVEALLGKPADTQIAYHSSFLSNDPGNLTGLFANVAQEVAPGILNEAKLLSGFDAKQAGGFATPDLSISGLTSQLGPLAGDLGKAANDVFDPSDFFGDVEDAAKLFGTLKLTDLLEPLTMGAGAPKVQLNKEDLPVPPPAKKVKLITTLDWTPEVKELNFGIVTFHPDKNGTKAKLEVHGRVEKIVELPPPANPDPGTAKMEGTLTDFRIELLHVVEVLFSKFAFASQTGQKMDVTVDLDPDTPVRFIDDLQFVETLRKSIPPGLFGDGPSLDINLTRIKAGFSITLPPVSVGVFSLKDITLAAFLELPFIEGKPLFDFSFSSREHPFNLTVAFLGGGGFFHLQIDTLGIKMLEAALEFGASASIDLGVASGGVHIMAGIYFSMQRRTIDGNDVDAATLEGYLRMGGELSVLGLISVSLEFYLCFAYESAKNAAYGRATLTVKVEVLFFSTSVEITVEKRFGGSGGDPFFLDTFDTPLVWDAYSGAFA
jgi:hypothetical protein